MVARDTPIADEAPARDRVKDLSGHRYKLAHRPHSERIGYDTIGLADKRRAVTGLPTELGLV
jgi:hypothetical protein